VTGCQVTSRLHDQFLRYSKWLDTFWTALVQVSSYCISFWREHIALFFDIPFSVTEIHASKEKGVVVVVVVITTK